MELFMTTNQQDMTKMLSNCPVERATMGQDVINLGTFSEPYYFHDIGLKHTSFCQSAICYIDGEHSLLLFRGYPIEQLAKHHDFTTIIFLLLYGDLPSKEQLNSLHQKLHKYGNIPDYCYDVINSLPNNLHPMGVLITLIGTLAADSNNLCEDHEDTAIKIIAQMPLLVSMACRHAQNLPPVRTAQYTSYVNHFLAMLFDKEPTDLTSEVFDTIFTLHAEHEQNASTCTMRVTSSTGTNPYAAISSALCALWGPAHGGANEACMKMLETIKTSDHIQEYIEKAKSKTDPFRLMGFGHRVYRNKDPRSAIMKSLCKRVLDNKLDKPLFLLAKNLEKIALEDPYFISHKLYPNVDFYSGIVQRALGVPNSCFTLIFALARTTGWMSHWLELVSGDPTPIIRPRQRYIGHKKRDLDQSSPS